MFSPRVTGIQPVCYDVVITDHVKSYKRENICIVTIEFNDTNEVLDKTKLQIVTNSEK